MKYLFEDFLDDQVVYMENETYYRNLFKKIVGKMPKDYYNTTFKNGKKIFDGNPIFNTKYNNRLIRIIQDEPESDKPYFHARIEKSKDLMEELVINLELSEEIRPTLERYLKKWFKDKVSVQEMEQISKTYAKEEIASNLMSEPEHIYVHRKSTYLPKKEQIFDRKIKTYTWAYKKKMNKDLNPHLLRPITKYCGASIYKRNAELVATSNSSELKTIKKNFLIKKLKLKDGPHLDEAINQVTHQLGKSNRHKYRAIFYYLLVKKFKKEYLFFKE